MSTLPSVERICADLIRFDTSNPGGDEQAAADYVSDALTELGLKPVMLQARPRRANVVARLAGADPDAPALLVQGHLDTVPADPAAWSHDPHGGDIADGYVWGRGAVDMKNAVAMTLSAVAALRSSGRQPRRDIVFAFVADEEAGGKLGAGFLVEEHPELFAGCRASIGEVGGFNVAGTEREPLFAVSVADRGLRWYQISEHGVAGHGSMMARDNPIPKLADTLARVLAAEHPLAVTEPMRMLAERIAGAPVSDEAEVRAVLTEATGAFAPMLDAGLRNTVNATRIGGGDKENVIPDRAWAVLDCRFLPGHEDDLHERITTAAGEGAQVRLLRRSPAVTSAPDGEWFDRLDGALRQVIPGARAVPFVFSGGTDNKWFRRLGMHTYGFTPLLLPPDYDYPAMFHGVDERCPVDALRFGAQVLEGLLCQ